MLKNLFLISILVIFQIYYLNGANLSNPKNPTDPTVKSSNSKNNANIEFQRQSGIFGKGAVSGLKGFYIKGLTWAGNENGNQEILSDFIKSIRVKGYTMVKKQKQNLGMVLYYPYIFDIEMKDGTSIKGAKGRIKELDIFGFFNDVGKEKCYTYFVRYWLEDKKVFLDNNSKNYDEVPKVPKQAVIYLEFKDN